LANVVWANVSGQTSYGQMHVSGQMSLGKFRVGKHHRTVYYSFSIWNLLMTLTFKQNLKSKPFDF
jgi:hypothetical protein